MQTKKIQLICWDLDGTLIDNFHTHYQSMCSVFESCRLPFPTPEEYSSTMPHNWIEFYHSRGITLPKETVQEIFHKTLASLPSPQLFEGAKKTLRTLKDQGITHSLVTLAEPERVVRIIEDFQLQEFFQDVKSGLTDKVSAIQEILRDTNTPPHLVAYVGDTPADIQAAKSLGILSVGFTKGFASHETLQKYSPDFLIRYHTEILKILRN